MNIEPVDGFDPSKISSPEKKLKYQGLEVCIKQPGRWFFMGYHSKQSYWGLKNGKTQLPGDRTRYEFKQDLSQVDSTNSSKFGVYVMYK